MGRQSIGEIEDCELAVIFFGGFIIGHSSLNLIIEVAEGYCSAVDSYAGVPLAFRLVPGDALVFRAGAYISGFGCVAEVLRMGGGAEIGVAIVEAVAVYVID